MDKLAFHSRAGDMNRGMFMYTRPGGGISYTLHKLYPLLLSQNPTSESLLELGLHGVP